MARMTTMLNDFNNLPPEVAMKHVIVHQRWRSRGPSNTVLNGFKQAKIKISTVAVGILGGHGRPNAPKCSRSPTSTGGKYYEPKIANALPRIYQKEARVVAQPLIFERNDGFPAARDVPARNAQGHGDVLPPITGYVLTNKKDNPLVEIALISPVGPTASTEANRTILAGWTYGLGKTVALTTDAGKRWATDWTRLGRTTTSCSAKSSAGRCGRPAIKANSPSRPIWKTAKCASP